MSVSAPPLEDGIREIDGKKRITRVAAAKSVDRTEAALRHWETMFRQDELSDPERLYPKLDCKVTRNPDPALTYPSNREVTYDLAGWLKLQEKIEAGPPEKLVGPDDKEYGREDLGAKRLGYALQKSKTGHLEPLGLRRLYQNIGGGRRRKAVLKSKHKRHGGSHHLGRQRIKVISGPWYCHSGPPTKYLRTKDIDAIKKSQDAAKNGWTEDEEKLRDPGEYLVEVAGKKIVCVDRDWCMNRDKKRKRTLRLDPDALDNAVAAGDIDRHEVISRKCGRETDVHPKSQVLAEIERLAGGFDGEYPDGRINLTRAENDYDIAASRLRDWIGAGIIQDAVKKRVLEKEVPRHRGLGQDQWAVTRDEMRRLNGLLDTLKRGGSLRLPSESTHKEICAAVGAEREADRILVGLLLQEGREAVLQEGREAVHIPARKPDVPIKKAGQGTQRVWLYDSSKAIAYLSSAHRTAAPMISNRGRPEDPEAQQLNEVCWKIYTSGLKKSLALREAAKLLGEDEVPTSWGVLKIRAGRWAKKNGLTMERKNRKTP